MKRNKLNIALIGYGKMGKIIEEMAKDRGHEIGLRISSTNRNDFNAKNLAEIDVAIEFTTPHVAAENLLILSENSIPTACGTTAWLERYDEICKSFTENNTGFLYASNFSIGVNLFFALNKHLARLMNDQNTYEISMLEAHHVTKKDAPSGTAVSLAKDIMNISDRKSKWSLSDKTPETIMIEVQRAEDIKGLHEIKYTSSIDEISIKHEAFSRKGFALGAVLAAEYIALHPGIHSMNEVLQLPPTS